MDQYRLSCDVKTQKDTESPQQPSVAVVHGVNPQDEYHYDGRSETAYEDVTLHASERLLTPYAE